MNDLSGTKRLTEAVANLAATITEIIESKVRAQTSDLCSKSPVSTESGKLLPAERWVGAKEAAAHLNVSLSTMGNWMRRGKVPYIRIGRSVRFKLSEVDSALNRLHGVESRF